MEINTFRDVGAALWLDVTNKHQKVLIAERES